MNRAELLKISPATPLVVIDAWLPDLNVAMDRFGIHARDEQACFVSQLVIETGGFRQFVENLNYRQQAIMTTFRGRFTPQQAAEFAFIPGKQKANQRMIANIAYGGRYGNGPAHTDDGWRFRGRGPIQLTFKANYEACGKAIGIDLVNSPEMLEQPRAGSLAAAWFWAKGNKTGKSLNVFVPKREFDKISLVINPGGAHLEQRRDLMPRAIQIMEAA